MKKIYSIIIATIIFAVSAIAQPTYQWAGAINCPNTDTRAIIVDGNGDVIVAGMFSNTADFDLGLGVFNLTATSANALYIAKYNSSGAFIWAEQIGGSTLCFSLDIKCDNANNIYITGMYKGTVDFDPGVGVANGVSTAGSTSSFIAKYNSSGNYIWHKYQKWNGGSNSVTSQGQQISIDETNTRVFVAFYLINNSGSIDTWTPFGGCSGISVNSGATAGAEGRFDMTTGACITIGSLNNNHFSVSVNNASNYFLEATYLFSTTPDLRLYKTDLTTLSTIWSKNVNSSSGTPTIDASNINYDSQNNVIITGHFTGVYDFDPSGGVFNMTSSTNGDIFILKLDANGIFLWAKQIGNIGAGIRCTSSIIDVNDNIILTGYFFSTTDFDPGLGTANLTPTNSPSGFVAKYDANGNYSWAFKLDDSAVDAFTFDIAKNSSDDIYVTGNFQGTIDFDPSTSTANLTAIGGGNTYMAKYAPCSGAPTQPTSITGPAIVCNGATNNYSITAVSGATSYTWVLPGGWTGTSTTTSINATASATGGTISVTANNACGSSTAQTLVVSVNNVNASVTPTNVLCNGNCNGVLNSTPTGTGPFTYVWSPGNQTAQNLNGQCAGTYTLTVTGAGGCTATQTSTITQPTAVTANASTTFTTCGTCCDGTASVIANGGSAPYTYVWQPGNLTTATLSGLCNGSYTVCVTDANGCTTCSTVNVSFNVGTSSILPFTSSISVYPNPFNEKIILQLEDLSGTAVAEIFNLLGENIYSASITNPQTEIDLNKIESGVYFIRVTTNEGSLTRKIIKE